MGDYRHIDGKYTASMLEAAASGAICFWHDTYGLGNEFKSVVTIPADPDQAAEVIKKTCRRDIAKLSTATATEIRKKCDPRKAAKIITEACVGKEEEASVDF
jgi:hypothetical protein